MQECAILEHKNKQEVTHPALSEHQLFCKSLGKTAELCLCSIFTGKTSPMKPLLVVVHILVCFPSENIICFLFLAPRPAPCTSRCSLPLPQMHTVRCLCSCLTTTPLLSLLYVMNTHFLNPEPHLSLNSGIVHLKKKKAASSLFFPFLFWTRAAGNKLEVLAASRDPAVCSARSATCVLCTCAYTHRI